MPTKEENIEVFLTGSLLLAPSLICLVGHDMMVIHSPAQHESCLPHEPHCPQSKASI